MKWSLLELNKYKDNPLNFFETLNVKESLMERDPSILDVAPVEVTGLLTVGKKEYLLHYNMNVLVTVPSSRSLTPVSLTLEIDVNEIFMTKEHFGEKNSEVIDTLPIEEIIILEKPIIDLTESVEDNILLAIPIQVLSEEERNNQELPKGNDWEVLSEEYYFRQKKEQTQQTVDPRLAKLSELLNEKPTKKDDK